MPRRPRVLIEGGLYHVYNRFARGEDVFADPEEAIEFLGLLRDSETARIRQLVAAVGIERWGQRAGRLAALLDKHPVAVSRWVTDAARRRYADSGFEGQMEHLDEELSIWALTASKGGLLSPRTPNR